MLAFFIAVLISLGIVTSGDVETMTNHEKQELIETNEIVITDVIIFKKTFRNHTYITYFEIFTIYNLVLPFVHNIVWLSWQTI